MKFAIRSLAVVLLVGLAACSHNVNTTPGATPPSPQYNAAVGSDDFSIGLRAFCDQAVNFKAAINDPAISVAIQQGCKKAAQSNKLASAAIRAGNSSGATAYLNASITILQGLTPSLLNIKDANSQAAMKLAQSSAIAGLQVAINLQPKP